MAFLTKDQAVLKRELVLDSMKPNWMLSLLFKSLVTRERSLHKLFNIVILKVSPQSDPEFLTKVRDFYSSPEVASKLSRTRFNLDLYDIDDTDPKHEDLLKRCLRAYPKASQIRSKNCMFFQRRIAIMYLQPAKMLYFHDCKIKLWNEPY